MLLTQKDSEEDVKSRLVYNGNETRKWLSREETASSIHVFWLGLKNDTNSYVRRDGEILL